MSKERFFLSPTGSWRGQGLNRTGNWLACPLVFLRQQLAVVRPGRKKNDSRLLAENGQFLPETAQQRDDERL